MSITFTTIDDTGEPLSFIEVPDEDHFLHNTPATGSYILGEAPPNSYWDGTEWVLKPERPSQTHYWDKTQKIWVGNDENQWTMVRIERDRLLKQSDWRVTKAVETVEPMDTGWKEYRQALRDITLQENPYSLVWPEQPV